MPTTLGSAFVPPPTVSPDQDGPADLALLAAVQELTEKVANLELPAPQVTVPAPQVRVDVPPLPAVPTAAEIGRAVASAIPVEDDSRMLGALHDVRDAVTALAKKQSAPRFGGGSALAMGLPALMNAAPASDTGQDALPVRIISQLGAGTGGGAASTVALDAPTLAALEVITIANPTANPETGLAKDATFTKDVDGGIKTHVQNFPTTQAVSGTVAVSNFPATQPVSIAATVPVSGTFWQATQPVSLATNTPDVIDRAARLLGHVTVDSAPTTAVTGTFWQTTQPVSLAANTPDVTDRAARLLGHVTVDNASLAVTGTFWQVTQPVSLAANTPTLAAGTNAIGNLNEVRAATTTVTVTAAAAAAATLTLPAAGAGLFHYITSLELTAYSAAARTGSATPWLITTTNITGSPVFTFSTAGAIGVTDTQRPIMSTPLKVAAANTATTFVAPAATGVIWRLTATYFVGA